MFKLDIEKAVEAILDVYKLPEVYGKDSLKHLDSEVLTILQNNKEPVPLLKTNMLQIHDSKITVSVLAYYSLLWSTIQDEYFERLEKITGKKPNQSRITCYMVTAPRCPYNPDERWFMLNLFVNPFLNMKNIGHELFHLHFHEHWFDKIANEIGEEKAHDIKEALTVLLNLEFKDLWYSEDRGYPQHTELREFILNEWFEFKNFEKLIDSCINFIRIKEVKQNGFVNVN